MKQLLNLHNVRLQLCTYKTITFLMLARDTSIELVLLKYHVYQTWLLLHNETHDVSSNDAGTSFSH